MLASFFSNDVVQDFKDNSDDDMDKRNSQEYLNDLKEVTSDDEEMVEIKLLMALSDVEKLAVRNEHARNGELGVSDYGDTPYKGQFKDNIRCVSKMDNTAYPYLRIQGPKTDLNLHALFKLEDNLLNENVVSKKWKRRIPIDLRLLKYNP
ncbi:hypothetical protein Tco_0214222 [Tanacetum coccineum]